jgi:hypothetical protein
MPKQIAEKSIRRSRSRWPRDRLLAGSIGGSKRASSGGARCGTKRVASVGSELLIFVPRGANMLDRVEQWRKVVVWCHFDLTRQPFWLPARISWTRLSECLAAHPCWPRVDHCWNVDHGCAGNGMPYSLYPIGRSRDLRPIWSPKGQSEHQAHHDAAESGMSRLQMWSAPRRLYRRQGSIGPLAWGDCCGARLST